MSFGGRCSVALVTRDKKRIAKNNMGIRNSIYAIATDPFVKGRFSK